MKNVIKRVEHWCGLSIVAVLCLCMGLVACSGGSSDAEPKEKQTTKKSQKLIKKKHDGQWGMVNEEGDTVVQFKYSQIGNFSEGRIPVMRKIDGGFRYGYLNEEGKVVIPLIYGDAHNFKHGYAKVFKKGHWGFINRDGDTVVGFIFEDDKDLVLKKVSEAQKIISVNNWIILRIRKDGRVIIDEKTYKNRRIRASNKKWKAEIRFFPKNVSPHVSNMSSFGPHYVEITNKQTKEESWFNLKQQVACQMTEFWDDGLIAFPTKSVI